MPSVVDSPDPIAVRGILLDIEGTVCPVSFVHDVLFPYALRALPTTLAARWDDPDFRPYRDAFPAEHASSPDALEAFVRDLSARDVKLPALKALQGLLWRQGYADGALVCTLFPDVPLALRSWHDDAGLPLVIYSSGSVPAQKLLFQYTDSGDWRPRIADYFDTVNAGPKTDAASYAKIAAARGLPAADWLFLSDNPREVAAAKEAGMQSLVVVREGNAPLSEEDKAAHTVITSFDQARIKAVQRDA